MPVPARGKDKKRTAARRSDPYQNVVIMSHLSVYKIFRSLFCVCVFFNKNAVFSGEQKKKKPLFVSRWDRKIRPSKSPFGFCVFQFFTSRQQSFSYKETGLPGLNQY